MADRLNGRDRRSARSRLLRVVFAAGPVAAGLDDAGAGSAAGPGLGTEANPEPSSEPGTATGSGVVEVDGAGRVTVEGRHWAVVLDELEPPRVRLILTGTSTTEEHQVLVSMLPDRSGAAAGVRRLEVVVDGWRFELDVDSEARARLRERATSARADAARGGPSELRAIIPGRVVSVDVAEGDPVERGGRLLVLEAMKMQNELKAPRAGTIARVAVAPGQTVELGDVLVVLE